MVDLRPLRRPKFVRELRKAAISAVKIGKENEKEMEGRGGAGWWGEGEALFNVPGCRETMTRIFAVTS
jgi:hypothetical protein